MSRLILVSGMHRSGTSALCGALNQAGVSFGEHLLPAAPGINDKGFFEDVRVMSIHDELLSAFGSSWYRVRPMQPGWLQSEAARTAIDALHPILEELLQAAPVVGVKDPRLSVLMPLWYQLLAEVGAEARHVIVVRPPVEVAQSLRARDDLAEVISYECYCNYYLDLLVHTATSPRIFVRFDELIADELAALRRISKAFGLDLQCATDETFVEPGLRHFRGAGNTEAQKPKTDEPDQGVREVADQLYASLCDLVWDAAAVIDTAWLRRQLTESVDPKREAAGYAARLVQLERKLREKDRELAYRQVVLELRDAHVNNIEMANRRHEADLALGGAMDARMTDLKATLVDAIADAHSNIESLSRERAQELQAQHEVVTAGLVQELEVARAENRRAFAALAQLTLVHKRDQDLLLRRDKVLSLASARLEAATAALAAETATTHMQSHALAKLQQQASELTALVQGAESHLSHSLAEARQLRAQVEHLRADNKMIVQSTLWRIMGPARSWVAGWRRVGRLMRHGRRHQVALQPVTGVALEEGCYQSDGTARLRVVTDRGELPGGRVSIAIALEGDATNLAPELHVEAGEPGHLIGYKLGAGISDIEVTLQLPDVVREIWFQPGPGPARFGVSLFTLTELYPWQ